MNAIVTTIRLSKFDNESNLPRLLNKEIKESDSNYILLIDDIKNSVELKTSCLGSNANGNGKKSKCRNGLC